MSDISVRAWALRTTRLPGLAVPGALLAAFVAGAPAAHGQDATVLEPIAVTATEVAPGGVQIREEDIEHANPTSIDGVFDGEAAVNAGGGSDVSRKVYVNGIEDTNLNVKIDGARQINSAFHHLGTAIIDPGLLKTVRVETGVGPADVGPGSLGGSIAYETKDARDFVGIDETFGGFGKLQYGTNGEQKRAVSTVAARHGAYEALAYGSWENGDKYEDGDDVGVAGTAPKMENFVGKGAWTGMDGDRIELTGGYTYDSGIRPNRANFGVLLNGSSPTKQAYKRQSLSLSYKDEAPSDMVNPELVLSVNRSSLSIDELAFGPQQFHFASTTTSYSGKAANTFQLGEMLGESGSVTVGTDFYHDVGEGDISGCFCGNAPLENEETSDNIGVFAQARVNVTNDLRVSAGGRYDQQWFEGIDGTDITGGGPSANANVEYDVAEGLTPYAGVGSTYGQIPLGESAIYNFAGQWDYAGLTSSRSYNYKLGLKGEHEGFSGDAHLFLNEIYGSHDRGSQQRNTTRKITSRGFNLAGEYAWIDGFVRATYTHNKVRSDGEILDSGSASFHGLQMGDIFTLGGAYDFGDTGVRIGSQAEYALKDDDDDAAVRPGYVTADLYAQYTPPSFQALELRLDVRNVTDATYVSRASSADVDNARADAFNEPGRSFLLTSKLSF